MSIDLFLIVLGVLFFLEGIYRLTKTKFPTAMAIAWLVAGLLILITFVVAWANGHFVLAS